MERPQFTSHNLCDIIYVMKQRLDNPFVLSGYVAPEYFCDRVKETAELKDAICNGRNVTLLAPRRMGKTGLIKNVFFQLEREKEWKTVYLDIYSATSLPEFAKRLAAAVLSVVDSDIAKALRAVGRFFRSFRPVVSIDAATGSPSYSFTIEPSTVETTLKECFDYLARDDRKIVVAIDEFQQVASFPEKGAEALLRSHIQFLPNVRFVFAGSKRHLMAQMFSEPNRPFYNSTQMFPLEAIDCDAYYRFAAQHMRKAGVSLAEDVFKRVYQQFDGITWYVQAVMNRLYGYNSAKSSDVDEAINKIIDENTYNYENIFEVIPAGSANLLRAIAAEGHVREVQAGGFVAKHGLKASSSAKQALARLLDLGMVTKCADGGYVVDDRFFAIWLTRN